MKIPSAIGVVRTTATTGGQPRVDKVDLPEIIDGNPAEARPSLIIVGASGTGKTNAIASIMAEGYKGLVVATENKTQGLLRYRPKVLYLNAPVGGMPPTYTDIYNRLMTFRDKLAVGEFRKHGDSEIDFLAIDSLMEVGYIFEQHAKGNRPVSSSTGEQNSFALWDKIGHDIISFVASLRDAASEATRTYGVKPIGVVVTCGEEWYTPKIGNGWFRAILPGNKGPNDLPYKFEAVLRLEVEREDDKAVYVAHAAPKMEDDKYVWFAKAPSVIPARTVLDGEPWTVGEIYKRMIEHYAQSTDTKGD